MQILAMTINDIIPIPPILLPTHTIYNTYNTYNSYTTYKTYPPLLSSLQNLTPYLTLITPKTSSIPIFPPPFRQFSPSYIEHLTSLLRGFCRKFRHKITQFTPKIIYSYLKTGLNHINFDIPKKYLTFATDWWSSAHPWNRCAAHINNAYKNRHPQSKIGFIKKPIKQYSLRYVSNP